MMPYRVEKVASADGLVALETEWRALERSSENTLPFRTFAWTSAWWRHLHEQRRAVSDSLAIRTIRTSDGRLVGVAPLTVTERPAFGPFRTRTLRFIGADPNLTEVRGLLCESGLEAACHVALNEALVRCAHEFDWMEWTGIDLRNGVGDALSRAGLPLSAGVAFYTLDLPPTWEALKSSGGRNLKESLRKCYNSLRRDRLEFRLTVVSKRADVGGALVDFFRLHSARASSVETLHHNDVFAHPACRSFLLDVCGQLADQGELRIFRLEVGGKLVATRIGFVLGESLYLYYSGYDPAYGKYGVMTTTVAEAIKDSIARGLRQVNLSSGADPSKLRWRPRESAFYETLLVSPGLVGRTKHAAMRLVSRAIQQPGMQRYAERFDLVRRTSHRTRPAGVGPHVSVPSLPAIVPAEAERARQ
jgi:CelD/BcsL family acetyltransferase involved in cellulose biosynthesis